MSNWSLPGYRELTELGRGGFGRVVLAQHEASGQVVAIKYLFGGGDRAQFRHEAAILSRVVSPHVARLYEFVEEPRGAAIVMEAVPGVALKAIIDEHGALPPESALAIMKGSLLGLAAAHAAGTVHRDYKPGNVLVQPNHQSKLVDFGIALLAGHASQSGTPAYMAPEQWRGGPATPATDVYAATCVFFLCVTGERPFPGNDAEQLRELHVSGRVPVELAPEPVRGLIARGMAKDVTQRPAGAAQFVTELEAAATAGYGRDWEAAGWRRLAGMAGALLALSPMAWVVSTTGVLTPAAVGTGAATGGALGGSAGAVAASKSAAGAVAAKIAATVIGIAVAAGGTVIAVEATGDDPPAAAETFTVDTVTEQASYEVDIDVTTEIVQVSNHEDPAVEESIDEQLRRPVDEEIASLREEVAGFREMLEGAPQGDDPVTISVEAEILLQNSEFLSVRYEVLPNLNGLSNTWWLSYETVTVDLRNGGVLTPAAMYQPEVSTPEGLDELEALLIRNAEAPLCPDADTGATELDFSAEYMGEAVAVAFTETGAEFSIDMRIVGSYTACGYPTVSVPYEDLGDVLYPDVIDRLTAG